MRVYSVGAPSPNHIIPRNSADGLRTWVVDEYVSHLESGGTTDQFCEVTLELRGCFTRRWCKLKKN